MVVPVFASLTDQFDVRILTFLIARGSSDHFECARNVLKSAKAKCLKPSHN